MFRKNSIKNNNDALKEFAKCVAYMRKGGITEKEIKYAVDVGFKGYNKFFKKSKPKFKVYEINANSKEEAIKQLKSLELDENIEKDIINILNKS